MILALLLGVRMVGTVDRVDNGLAVVEWSDGEWGILPADRPGGPLREGERVRVWVAPEPLWRERQAIAYAVPECDPFSSPWF